ncbi:MAG: TonB-dependent receptor [Runella sp.]
MPRLCEVSGTVRDSTNGKPVPNCNLLINFGKVGIMTDTSGYFSYTLPGGNHSVILNRLGYRPFRTRFVVTRDTVLDIRIMQVANELDEVVITTQAVDQNITKPILGVSQLSIKTIKKLPAMMGEVDVMRSLQLLPGVTSVGEASNGVNVRGGTVDQNLILLDDAPVLNPTHLFGLFSVFPPDAVSTMDLYKGTIPARFGGRAAAVLDISMANPNLETFKLNAGIGPVSSRLTTELPLVKGKLGMLISGRGSFNDFWFKIGPPRVQNIRGNFADGAIKMFYRANFRNTITISAYANQDFFQTELLGGINALPSSSTQFNFKTLNLTAKWYHAFSEKLDMQLVGVYSDYRPRTLLPEPDNDNVVTIGSRVLQRQIKLNFNYLPTKRHKIEWGGNVWFYQIQPGELNPGDNQAIPRQLLPTENAIEASGHLEDEITIGPKTTLSVGGRYSYFMNLGPAKVRFYREGQIRDETNIESEKTFGANEVVQTYQGLEPRIGFRQTLSETSSFKMGYNLMRQYLQVITNATTPLPTSRWKTSDPNIRPQVSQLFSAGVFKNFNYNIYEFSLEGYFRQTQNILDYKPGADFLLRDHLETQILQGKSKAYGIETMIARKKGELTGWISYTYSRVLNQVNEGLTFNERINGGRWYPANFDRPHSLNFSMTVSPNKWHTFSLTFTYATGRPFTAPTGLLRVDNRLLPFFSDRNNDRIKDYHRLDFSWHIHNPRDKQGKWRGDWIVSVYNVYGRQNQYSVFTQPFENSFRTYELTILNIPFVSLTYNFSNTGSLTAIGN